MISVKNLVKRYGEITAVNDVSFEIARGEIVGLVGHNGAGKTTVMKAITGYLEPTSGLIAVGGKDVIADRLGVQRQIGYLPENAPLYPEMLVQEYLVMMAELRQVPPDRRLDAIARAVRATGLVKVLTQRIGKLSKGYRQRVGIAQAILHDPELLILDEPTNGLDPVQNDEIRRLIRRLAEKSTVILSTHNLREVEVVCNRVLMMMGGKLVVDSTIAEALKSARVRVSVKSDTPDAGRSLGAIAGVKAARRLGNDGDGGGYDLWELTYEGHEPTGAIIRLAAEKGWDVRSVAPVSTSLESRYREEHDRFVARQQEVAA
jgi:ABC-2 type transport system ATP-binding protein